MVSEFTSSCDYLWMVERLITMGETRKLQLQGDLATVEKVSSDFFTFVAFQKVPTMEEDQAFQHLFT